MNTNLYYAVFIYGFPFVIEYLEYQQRIMWKVEKDIKEKFEGVNVETMQSNTTVFGDFNGSII